MCCSIFVIKIEKHSENCIQELLSPMIFEKLTQYTGNHLHQTILRWTCPSSTILVFKWWEINVAVDQSNQDRSSVSQSECKLINRFENLPQFLRHKNHQLNILLWEHLHDNLPSPKSLDEIPYLTRLFQIQFHRSWIEHANKGHVGPRK